MFKAYHFDLQTKVYLLQHLELRIILKTKGFLFSSVNMKHSILIVDDEKAICDGLSKLLSDDYVTYKALNGREAIEVLKNNKDIELILCDIMMPIMDGTEMIEKIRSENKQVKIIVITAFSTPDRVFNAIVKGANAYLIKPLDIIQLEQIIKNIFERQQLATTIAET